MGLKIESNLNLKWITFLAVTFNLNVNSCKPFNETNTIPTYVIVYYNHQTPIIKQIPFAINIRIYRLSFSKMTSNKHKEIYHKSLHNSGY